MSRCLSEWDTLRCIKWMHNKNDRRKKKEAFKYLSKKEKHPLDKCYHGPSIDSVTFAPKVSLFGRQSPRWWHRKILYSHSSMDMPNLLVYKEKLLQKKNWKLAEQVLNKRVWKVHIEMGMRGNMCSYQKPHPQHDDHNKEKSQGSRAIPWRARGLCSTPNISTLGCTGEMRAPKRPVL